MCPTATLFILNASVLCILNAAAHASSTAPFLPSIPYTADGSADPSRTEAGESQTPPLPRTRGEPFSTWARKTTCNSKVVLQCPRRRKGSTTGCSHMEEGTNNWEGGRNVELEAVQDACIIILSKSPRARIKDKFVFHTPLYGLETQCCDEHCPQCHSFA
jgi:hypothetical protein